MRPHRVTVAEAARLLSRNRARVYALLKAGDLVAAPPAADDGEAGPLRIDRSSLDRWLVAGGARGGPLAPRNAWALIGLASGDQPFSERSLGLLERAEEVSRTRARLARERLEALAPRLRRRTSLVVLQAPKLVRQGLEHEASLVRTGVSAARPYGWREVEAGNPWALDAYLPIQALERLQESLAGASVTAADELEPVLLRAVDDPWPFPPHYQLASQPLAALDLLDYPHPAIRRLGREVLASLGTTAPQVLARRSARGRATSGPALGRLLQRHRERAPRPVVEGDPRTETRAAAAHIVGVL